jgi:hypothetical protein
MMCLVVGREYHGATFSLLRRGFLIFLAQFITARLLFVAKSAPTRGGAAFSGTRAWAAGHSAALFGIGSFFGAMRGDGAASDCRRLCLRRKISRIRDRLTPVLIDQL